MPKQEKMETKTETEEVSVVLKPILGIRPGVYLTVLYAIIVALVAFLVFFNPGLRHRGAYLSVTTFPAEATVKVDGVYAGSTPTTIFLKKGSHDIEVSKPFYTPVTVQRQVRGRVFFTLFVKDQASYQATLALSDVDGLLSWALADFQKNPEIPSIVSRTAFAAFGSDTAALRDFIAQALLFTTNEEQLRQLILAAARVYSHGTMLTPSSLVALLQSAADTAQGHTNFPAWALLTLSSANANALKTESWVKAYTSALKTDLAKYYLPSAAPASAALGGVTIGGMAFRTLPAGTLVMGKDDALASLDKGLDRTLPHPVQVASFSLGVTEVSNAQYRLFVSANPEWAPSNLAALQEKGLVTDAYLAGWVNGAPPSGSENLPVTSVSWFAAQAYCAWLSRQVQAVLPGFVARLPSESEWEWAARGGLRGMPYPGGAKIGSAIFFKPGIIGPSAVGATEPNGYGLRDMMGNAWEWCSDPFSLNASLLSSRDPETSAALEKSLPAAP